MTHMGEALAVSLMCCSGPLLSLSLQTQLGPSGGSWAGSERQWSSQSSALRHMFMVWCRCWGVWPGFLSCAGHVPIICTIGVVFTCRNPELPLEAALCSLSCTWPSHWRHANVTAWNLCHTNGTRIRGTPSAANPNQCCVQAQGQISLACLQGVWNGDQHWKQHPDE